MSEAPGKRLTFTKEAFDVEWGHVEGLGAVYWLHRSPQWGNEWQAFERRAGGQRRPIRDVRAKARKLSDLHHLLRARPLTRLVTPDV